MQRRFSALCGNGQLKGDTLFQKRVSPFQSPERNFALADCSLKSCAACGIRCLLGVVSKRLGLLLSSLSLCLRFVTLTQFPSTTDFHCFVCRGGLAGTRCNMEADGGRKLVRTSTSWAERHPQGVCRIRKAAEPPTAAQQRMIGAEANRIAASNAATPRAGSSIGKCCSSSSCSLAMQTPFFWTVTPPVFFPRKENGGCGTAARTPHDPAPFGRDI